MRKLLFALASSLLAFSTLSAEFSGTLPFARKYVSSIPGFAFVNSRGAPDTQYVQITTLRGNQLRGNVFGWRSAYPTLAIVISRKNGNSHTTETVVPPNPFRGAFDVAGNVESITFVWSDELPE